MYCYFGFFCLLFLSEAVLCSGVSYCKYFCFSFWRLNQPVHLYPWCSWLPLYLDIIGFICFCLFLTTIVFLIIIYNSQLIFFLIALYCSNVILFKIKHSLYGLLILFIQTLLFKLLFIGYEKVHIFTKEPPRGNSWSRACCIRKNNAVKITYKTHETLSLRLRWERKR